MMVSWSIKFALMIGMMSSWSTTAVVECKFVHVVFSSHMDIGFNNIEPQIGWDNNVINKYFNEYYPRAVDIADAVAQQSPHGDRYIYTTSAWMLSLFLDCPGHIGLRCPDAETRAKVLRGIEAGIITWHAHPHKPQFEFYDSSLLAWATDFTHDMDKRFGFKPKHTVMLRDVPGLTRATIPILVSRGVKAISVGVNQASAPPGVPFFTPFIWRDEASGQQLLAVWRPGGYGGYHRDLILDPPEQCIQAPGLAHVLCTSWRWDNSGPALDVSDPLKMFEVLREEWAGDQVFASTLDAFFDAVLEALPILNLTVVTQEIGDSWIWGVQSDPLKTANFRAASRARAACIADPACPSDTSEFYEFSRLLLKVAEHTWGVDVKKTLHDFDNYSNPDFYSCLPQQLRPTAPAAAVARAGRTAAPAQQQQQQQTDEAATPGTRWDGRDAAPCQNYEDCIASWERQATYVDWAIQALPADHPVAAAFAADLAARQQLAAVEPDSLAVQAASVLTFERKAEPATTADKQSAVDALTQKEQSFLSRTQQERQLITENSMPSTQTKQSSHGVSAAGGVGPGTAAAASSSGRVGHVTGMAEARSYVCGSWQLEIDPEQGGITSLIKRYAGAAGTDWARGTAPAGSTHGGSSPSAGSVSDEPFSDPSKWQDCSDSAAAAAGSGGVLGQLVYHAYSEASYDFVWNFYGWEQPAPWWFPLDFGKVNSSQAWPRERQATASLNAIYESLSPADGALTQLSLRHSFPQLLVKHSGAPPVMVTTIRCPAASQPDSYQGLDVSVAWQDKPPTRLPEALWLGFRPAPSAVDAASWKLHKLDSSIGPLEVLVNGSQSMHAVSDLGVSVTSSSGQERLLIQTFDAALVSPGRPTAFPNGQFPPCLVEGMHFNLVNNVWGTNYPAWIPFSTRDVNLAFRFKVDAVPVVQAAAGSTAGPRRRVPPEGHGR